VYLLLFFRQHFQTQTQTLYTRTLHLQTNLSTTSHTLPLDSSDNGSVYLAQLKAFDGCLFAAKVMDKKDLASRWLYLLTKFYPSDDLHVLCQRQSFEFYTWRHLCSIMFVFYFLVLCFLDFVYEIYWMFWILVLGSRPVLICICLIFFTRAELELEIDQK
jgi:hypothetical protein